MDSKERNELMRTPKRDLIKMIETLQGVTETQKSRASEAELCQKELHAEAEAARESISSLKSAVAAARERIARLEGYIEHASDIQRPSTVQAPAEHVDQTPTPLKMGYDEASSYSFCDDMTRSRGRGKRKEWFDL